MKKVFRAASGHSDLRVQSYRVETSAEAPQLPLRELSPFFMNGFSPNGASHPNGNPAPHDQLTVTPTRGAASRAPSLSNRRTSALRELSPLNESPPDDENQQWSSAVGGATLGKSGRVIERLMADIDRLKRELNAEIQHRQEIEKREHTNRSTMDRLEAENTVLTQDSEVNQGIIGRRDRMIKELKEDLNAERERRQKAEEYGRSAVQQREEAVAESRKEVAEAKEVAKYATSHTEVLEQSHRQLSAEYRQRAETFAKDLDKLTADREKVQRLAIVVEQQNQEIERSHKVNAKMNEAMSAYKQESHARIQQLQDRAETSRRENENLVNETQRVVGEARWLINAGKLNLDKKR